MNKDPVLKTSCALLTGGARNIDLAIAREVAVGGMNVAIVDILHDLNTVPYPLLSKGLWTRRVW